MGKSLGEGGGGKSEVCRWEGKGGVVMFVGGNKVSGVGVGVRVKFVDVNEGEDWVRVMV